MHDLDVRWDSGPPFDGMSRANDRPDLHLVDLRPLEPEPAAAGAEHRVRLVERDHPLACLVVADLVERRQELVQRRVEQTDRHRQLAHRLEEPFEVGLLHRQQPSECGRALLVGRRENHLAHDREPVGRHEHVLGAAEADSFRSVCAGAHRVGRCVGVREHAQAPRVVCPAEDELERRARLGLDELDGTEDDLPGRTVDSDQVAFADRRRADGATCSSTSTWSAAHPATQGLPMPRATTAACDVMPPRAVRTPLALIKPWMSSAVVSGRTRITSSPAAAQLGCPVGVEDRATTGRAGGRCEPDRDHFDRRVRVDRRMQQLLDRLRVDAPHGFARVDRSLVDECDRRGDRGETGALRRACLQG